MKKLLFVISVLTLMSYGCNRNSDKGTGTDNDIQREEMDTKVEEVDRKADDLSAPVDSSMDAAPEGNSEEAR